MCGRPVEVKALADRGIRVDVASFLAVGIHDFSSLFVSCCSLSFDSVDFKSFDLKIFLFEERLSTGNLSVCPFWRCEVSSWRDFIVRGIRSVDLRGLLLPLSSPSNGEWCRSHDSFHLQIKLTKFFNFYYRNSYKHL